MSQSKIFVFWNEGLDSDSLPLKILPNLKKRFPALKFETKDPNEEIDFGKESVILDTAEGIKESAVFSDLNSFIPMAKRLTTHDFDLYTNLALLKKMGRLGPIKIIGVPPGISEKKALEQVTEIIKSI